MNTEQIYDEDVKNTDDVVYQHFDNLLKIYDSMIEESKCMSGDLLSNDYIYITFLLFFLFVTLNLIVNSFLKNKEKNISDLNMNIKSIIKSSD